VDDATNMSLRDRTRHVQPLRSLEAEDTDARELFLELVNVAEPGLVGPSRELDPGLYYHPSSGGE
jgi:NitT/TauT family transport system substrate-binding protein